MENSLKNKLHTESITCFARTNAAITLIALVVTIIILLILAGVTISLIAGNGGILGRAEKSVNVTQKSIAEEEIKLAINEFLIAKREGENRELPDFLSENLENLVLSDKNEDNIVVKYKGYQFKIDNKYHVTLLEVEDEIKLVIDKFKKEPEDNELSTFLQKNLADSTVYKTDNKIIVEYKGSQFEIDSNYNVTAIEKSNIRVFTTLEPNTYTTGSVTITIDVQLEAGLTLESVKPISEGIEVIEANKSFRVTENKEYQFEVIASGENKKTITVNVDKIDKANPEVKIIDMPAEVSANEPLTIAYEITDDVEVDISKCKYAFTRQNKIWDVNDEMWNKAEDLQQEKGNITETFEEGVTIYLHILAVDKVGNYVSYTAPNPIKVKPAPLYLFNEGPVEGYEWKRISGNISSEIANGAIHAWGMNGTWNGATYVLSGMDLTNYNQVHMEVTTGNMLATDGTYGLWIGATSTTNYTWGFISVTEQNLVRATVHGNLVAMNGKEDYRKPGQTLYLVFPGYTRNGAYVHKIWID